MSRLHRLSPSGLVEATGWYLGADNQLHLLGDALGVRSTGSGDDSQWIPSRGPEWVLDWDERFDTLDTTKWNVTNQSNPVSNHSAVWRSANVSTDGGLLRIESKNDGYNGHNWTSGNIQAYAPFRYATPGRYFRAEVRFKAPHSAGFWPAPLWWRPVHKDNTSSVQSGEIDVYEGWGSQRPNYLVKATLHGSYDISPRHQYEAWPFKTWASMPAGRTDPNDWHVATIEKTPNKIEIWMDNVKLTPLTSGVNYGNWVASDWPAYIENANYRWSPRITMQLGLPSAGENPDGSVDWSYDASTMFIDYLRVYDYQP